MVFLEISVRKVIVAASVSRTEILLGTSDDWGSRNLVDHRTTT
jgi:hypothetical protein